MMGRRERGQGQFLYAFDLDKVVPADQGGLQSLPPEIFESSQPL